MHKHSWFAAAIVAAGVAVVTPKAQHLTFDDDKVEGDIQRGDDPLIESRNHARFGSLIRVRANFIPEMLKTAEDL